MNEIFSLIDLIPKFAHSSAVIQASFVDSSLLKTAPPSKPGNERPSHGHLGIFWLQQAQ